MGLFGSQPCWLDPVRISRFSAVLPLVFLNHHEASDRLLDPPVGIGLDLRFPFHNIRKVGSLDLIKLLLLDDMKQWNDEILADEVQFFRERG